MGVDIKLSDRDLPASPVFIDFLHRRITGGANEASWHDQVSEELVPGNFEKRVEQARGVAESVIAHPLGQKVILRSYELFTAMLTGNESKLKSFHDRFRFIVVVGCPRHGGTYLTKQLFRALGHEAETIPNVIAHDGFPDSSPFFFGEGINSYTHTMLQTAEYLAMVEEYFGDRKPIDGKIMVPKKATKAAYNGAFFRTIFGADAEYLVTLRHPLASCISTYEKSGGLPDDGLFRNRSNIEEWARRDLIISGLPEADIDRMPYLDAYLGYWRYYHRQLADTGLAAVTNLQLIPYGRERLMDLAGQFNRRFGISNVVEDFEVKRKGDRHPEWMPRADAALHQIGALWRAQGLAFPMAELGESW